MPFFYKKPTKTKAVVAKLPILPSSTPSSTSTISTISIKVFIIHYKKLVQRKINVINQLKKHGITNFEFIEIDRDELHKHDTRIFATGFANYQQAICLSHFYVYNQIIKNDLNTINTAIAGNGICTLSSASINLIISHIETANTLIGTRKNHDINFYRNSRLVLADYSEVNKFSNMGETNTKLAKEVVGTDKLITRLNS